MLRQNSGSNSTLKWVVLLKNQLQSTQCMSADLIFFKCICKKNISERGETTGSRNHHHIISIFENAVSRWLQPETVASSGSNRKSGTFQDCTAGIYITSPMTVWYMEDIYGKKKDAASCNNAVTRSVERLRGINCLKIHLLLFLSLNLGYVIWNVQGISRT